MLGVSLATRYASDSAVPPSTAARAVTRISPVMRERNVPAVTTRLLRSSPVLLLSVDPFDLLDRLAQRFEFDHEVVDIVLVALGVAGAEGDLG